MSSCLPGRCSSLVERDSFLAILAAGSARSLSSPSSLYRIGPSSSSSSSCGMFSLFSHLENCACRRPPPRLGSRCQWNTIGVQACGQRWKEVPDG